jgi:hypothetical protein
VAGNSDPDPVAGQDDGGDGQQLHGQATSKLSRVDCIPVASASTGSPAKDSFVVTCTPAGVWLKTHSWTAVMPPAVPPHSTRARSATAKTVETTVKP